MPHDEFNALNTEWWSRIFLGIKAKEG